MAALARPTPGATTDVTTESMTQETFPFIPRVLVTTLEHSEDLAAEGRVPESDTRSILPSRCLTSLNRSSAFLWGTDRTYVITSGSRGPA